VTDFDTYSLDTVPESGRDTLETVNKAYGFVPNLLGTMVESPAVARAYLDLSKAFASTSFNQTERQVILLTASRINECEYCIAAHSTAAKMGKVPTDVITAIRRDLPLADARLQHLREFTIKVIESRGRLDDNDVARFLDAGFTRAQVLEVVLGVSMKTLSNYVNHIAATELDEAFGAAEWRAPDSEAA